jgi:drug/metabolite transporter (DMT)-like permease
MAGKGMQGRAQSGKGNPKPTRRSGPSEQVIPDAVANRMARRIAIGTGIPTVMGMGVFVGSYLLVSRQIFDVPPSATLAASAGCFFLGLLGLSFGVLSASWEEKPGSLLGSEQIRLNISRLRSSVKSMRNGAGNQPTSSGRQER